LNKNGVAEVGTGHGGPLFTEHHPDGTILLLPIHFHAEFRTIEWELFKASRAFWRLKPFRLLHGGGVLNEDWIRYRMVRSHRLLSLAIGLTNFAPPHEMEGPGQSLGR
jgi:hypothetical protein